MIAHTLGLLLSCLLFSAYLFGRYFAERKEQVITNKRIAEILGEQLRPLLEEARLQLYGDMRVLSNRDAVSLSVCTIEIELDAIRRANEKRI